MAIRSSTLRSGGSPRLSATAEREGVRLPRPSSRGQRASAKSSLASAKSSLSSAAAPNPLLSSIREDLQLRERPDSRNDTDGLQLVAEEIFTIMAGAGAARGQLRRDDFEQVMARNRTNLPPALARVFPTNAFQIIDTRRHGVVKRAAFVKFVMEGQGQSGKSFQDYSQLLREFVDILQPKSPKAPRLRDSRRAAAQVRSVFQVMDLDSSGEVTQKEFQAFQRSMSYWCDPDIIEDSVLNSAHFDELDIGKDGKICLEDFEAYMESICNQFGEEGLLNLLGQQLIGWEQACKRRQRVRDGVEKLQACLVELGRAPGSELQGPCREAAGALFQLLDQDDSGAVNPWEFSRFAELVCDQSDPWVWSAEDFSKLDKNGDGKISGSELFSYLWEALKAFGRRRLLSQLHNAWDVLRREVEMIEVASGRLQDVLDAEAPLEELHGRLCYLSQEAETTSMPLHLFQRLFMLAAEGLAVPARPSGQGELWKLRCLEHLRYRNPEAHTRNMIEEFVLLPSESPSAASRALRGRVSSDWKPVELRAASFAPLQVVDPVIELRCFLRLSSRLVRTSVTFHQLRDAAQTAAARGTPPSLQDLRELITSDHELRIHIKSNKVSAASLVEFSEQKKIIRRRSSDFEWARAQLPSHGLTNLRLSVPDGEYAAVVDKWPVGHEGSDPNAAVIFVLKDLKRRYHMSEVQNFSWSASCTDGRELLEVDVLHPCLEEPTLSSRSEANLTRYHRYVAAGGDLSKLLRSAPAVVLVSASSSEGSSATFESRSAKELTQSLEASLQAAGCWVTINLWPPWLACLSGVSQCSASRSLHNPKCIQAAAYEFAKEFAQMCADAAAQSSAERYEVVQDHLEALRSDARLRVRRLHCALQQCPTAGPLGKDGINVPSRAAVLSRCIRAIESLEAAGGSPSLEILMRCFTFRRFNLGFQLVQEILARNPTLLMPKKSEVNNAGSIAAEQVLNHEPPLPSNVRRQVLEYLHKHGAKLSKLLVPMVRHHRCDDVVLLFEVCLGERGVRIKSTGFGNEPLRKRLHNAAVNNDAETVRSVIIESRLSPDIRDRNGQTAAHHAAWHGHLNVLEVLHYFCGNFNVTDNDGATALHYATSTAVEKLRSYGCSPSAINKDGCTPLMLSRRRKNLHGAMYKTAALDPKVHWSQIQAILGRDSSPKGRGDDSSPGSRGQEPLEPDRLDDMVKKLLQLGFGSEAGQIFQKSAEGAKVINPADELQIRNQLDDNSGFQRARYLCTNLVVPLLELAGKKELNDPEHGDAGIQRKSFCKYLLQQRVASFAPAEVLTCAKTANGHLMGELHAEYEKPENNILRSLTTTPTVRVKDGVNFPVTNEKDSWLHQRDAHGYLPWLEGRDGQGPDDLEAVAMLVELGLFETAEDLCDWGASSWGRDAVYALYLQAVAKSADGPYQATMKKLVASVPGAEYQKGNLKGQERMLFKGRGEYADQALEVYGDRDLGVGAVVDICRLSICCENAEVLCRLVEELKTKRVKRDGVEVIRIKNMFHPDAWAGAGYRDVKLAMMVTAPDLPGSPGHIAECQILLRPYLKLKKFQHLLYEIERGDFYDKQVRVAMEIYQLLAPSASIAEDKLEMLPTVVESAYNKIYKQLREATDLDIFNAKKRMGSGCNLLVVLEEKKQQEKLLPIVEEQENVERATRSFSVRCLRNSILKPRDFDDWLKNISSPDALCKILAMLKSEEDFGEPDSPSSPFSPGNSTTTSASLGTTKRRRSAGLWSKATDDITKKSRARKRSPVPLATRLRGGTPKNSEEDSAS